MAMLADDDISRLKEDGLLVLHQLLDVESLESVRQSVADFADGQIKELVAARAVGDPHEEAPFETRWAIVSSENDLQNGEHWVRQWGARNGLFSESIYNLAIDSRLTDVIASIIGPELMVRGDYWVRPKIPSDPRTTLPWHQDSHYYGSSTGVNFGVLTVWIPLIDVDDHNGCLKLVRGSNRYASIEARRNDRGQMEPIEDVSKFGTVVSVPMKVGDVLIFTNLTLHASGNNASDQVRWSMDLRYAPFDLSTDLDTAHPGCVIRSDDPTKVMSFAQWQEKWRVRWAG